MSHINTFSPPSKKFECAHCKRILSSKYSLKIHQTKTKICRKLQGLPIRSDIECKFCGYATSIKSHYTRHLKVCPEKKLKEQSEEKDILRKLQDKVLVLETKLELKSEYEKEFKKEAFKPKTTNNNNNQTINMQIQHSEKILEPYDEIKKKLELLLHSNFSKRDFLGGIPGLCRVINTNLLNYNNKKWMVSYENSKSLFHKKLDNEIKTDDKAKEFLLDIYPYVLKVASEHKDDIFFSDTELSEKNKALKMYKKFESIGVPGSAERKECINIIAENNYISNMNIPEISKEINE